MSEPARDASAAAQLFAGPGEMRERCRAFDWSRSAVGAVDYWPKCWRTTIQLVLAARLPMLAVWWPSGSVIYNDSCRDVLGRRYHHALGQPLLELWREYCSIIEPIYARVRSGESVWFEDARIPVERATGLLDDAWLTINAWPVRDEAGAVAGAVVAGLETTRRKQAEARQTFMLGLLDVLRPLSEPTEIMAEACRALAQHLNADRVYYVEFNEAEEYALIQTEYRRGGLVSLRGRYDYAEFPGGLELLRKGPVVVSDVARADMLDERTRRTILALGIGAIAVGPLTKQGLLVGAIVLAQSTARVWCERESALLSDVGECTWAVVERAKAEQDVRVAEDRQAFLLALSDRMRSLGEPQAIMSVAAEMFARHLGLARTSYCLVDSDQDGFEFTASYSDGRLPIVLPGSRGRLSNYGPGWGAGLRAGQEMFSSNNQADPRELVIRTAGTELQSAAGAAIPLVKDGRLVAFMSAGHATVHEWTYAERSLFREVAERTWSAAVSARAEQEKNRLLQQREDLLAALTLANEEANRANQAKDDFLATLGHELRTPLSAILLWAGALRSGNLPPPEMSRAVEAILRSAQAQSRLIEDLLDLSRLASGKVILLPHRTAVEKLIRTAVELVQGTADAKGVQVELVIADYLGAALLDSSRIQQVLLNLLSNAIKFTPAGGRVTVHASKQNGYLRAEVTDTGQGIAADFMPRLFERFTQAEGGDTRQHAGLGIGLALSRQLVELHAGNIEAFSEGPGKGARFTVTIPWYDADEDSVDTPSGPRRAAVLESPLSGASVLLVEDDASTGEAMQWTLMRAGASVRRAATARETLELLEATEPGDPTVIVSDLGLPGISGYELIQTIVRRRQERGLAPIPACAVSAHARDVDRTRAIQAGFDMYLVKPVTPERLIEAVRDLCELPR